VAEAGAVAEISCSWVFFFPFLALGVLVANQAASSSAMRFLYSRFVEFRSVSVFGLLRHV